MRRRGDPLATVATVSITSLAVLGVSWHGAPRPCAGRGRAPAPCSVPPPPSRVLPLEKLLAFEREGHVVTRGLLARQEFEELALPLRRLAEGDGAEAHAEREDAARHAAETMSQGGLPDEAPPFLQTFNPHRRHAAALRLALALPLAAAAATLLCASRVRLYQTALFWKRPGDDATGWHADLWTVPLATNDFVSVWLPLRQVDGPQDAPLFYRPRTHRDLAVMAHDEQYEELGVDIDDVPPPGLHGVHHAPLAEGDATWHHGWTIHGAPPVGVLPPEPEAGAGAAGAAHAARAGRLAFGAAYFADGALALREAPDPEDEPSYEAWLGDVVAGAPVSHQMLPLVWPPAATSPRSAGP